MQSSKEKAVCEYVEKNFGDEYSELLSKFRNIQAEQYLLFAKKNHDYGMRNVTAGTDLSTEEDVKFALTGLWFRMSDRFNRWKNIMTHGWTCENESFLDTLQDIANYAMIAQMVARGLWNNEKESNEESAETGQADKGE